MKHARSDYDVIQDCTPAVELANAVLDMSFATAVGRRTRELAREVLASVTADRVWVEATTVTTDTRLRIPADEPVFLLRGQDELASEVVVYWARRAEQAGARPDIIDAAYAQARKMAGWPKKKTPDLPVHQKIDERSLEPPRDERVLLAQKIHETCAKLNNLMSEAASKGLLVDVGASDAGSARSGKKVEFDINVYAKL